LLAPAIALGSIIRGHARDGSSGEAIPSVVATLEGTDLGDITDNDGYFMIADVPPGAYELRVTALGYDELRHDVLIVGDTTVTLDFRLTTAPIPLQEVKVTAQRAEFKQEVRVSSLSMTRGQLRTTPFVVESDLFRALQALPGIVAANDFSAASFVRGGNADQNLVLLDGVSIYNPTHLGGLFSVFDPDIVSSADLLTGGFPAEYGGRLSSVLDIATRTGNSRALTGNIASSMLASKALVEGPIPNDTLPGALNPRGSFFISGRRTYFDQLLSLIGYSFPYYFYDVTGKASFNYAEDTKLALSGFSSTDRFDLGQDQSRIFMDWGNRLASLSWHQYWTPRLGVLSLLTYNNYFYDIDIANDLIGVHDTISEYALKTHATYQLSGENELSAGLEAEYSTFTYKAGFLGGFKFDITGQPLLTSAFVQAKLKPTSQLLVQPGLRLDYYWITGDVSAKYLRPSPRLSFKYFLNDIFAIKGALGRYHQYVSALYPDFSPIPSLFFWVPIFGDYTPQQADHAILGAERWLDENTNLTLEGYYKRYGKIYQMSNNARPDSLETTLFEAGAGRSLGLDVLLRRDWGKLTGWISYSLCYARVNYGGQEYAPSYDRRHILNLVLNYALPAGYGLTAHWSYGSGMPYTATVGYYRRWHYGNGYDSDHLEHDWVDIGSGKNAARYPDYHRLDLGFEKTFNVAKSKLTLQLQVINVYNQKNLLLYQWDYSKELVKPQRRDVNQLPLLPSFGLKWSF
jgi:hypothetical protein